MVIYSELEENSLERVLNEAFTLIKNNSKFKKKKKALPVFAAIFNDQKIYININNKAINHNDPEKFKTHAEWKCMKEFKENEENLKGWKILISMPPCHHCFRELISFFGDELEEIIYLTKIKQNHKFVNLKRKFPEEFKKVNLVCFCKFSYNKELITVKKEIVKPLENYLIRNK